MTRRRDQDALVAATSAGRLPRRPRVGAAGVAGPAQPPDVADPVLLGRGAAQRRGFVLVDAVDGRVVEHFVEDNPEDWAES